MRIADDRRGVTLVELILVTVLGAFVLAGIYQVLVQNQRTYTAQSTRIRNQQTLRSGLDVLTSELRGVSPGDGDLLEMGTSAIGIRAPRGMGLVCSILTGGSNPTVQAKRVGNFLEGDSARVYYENHPSREADDGWRTAVVDVVDSTGMLSCPGGSVAQELRLRGIRWGAPPDSFSTGAPIRNFAHYRFLLDDVGGETYLVREDPEAGTSNRLVGPLASGDGVEFRYLDGSGDPTTTAATVRQIEVTLRTPPRRQGSQGELVRDSLTARVHTRNVD